MRRIYSILIILLLAAGCSEHKTNPTLPSTHPESWMDPSSVDFHGSAVFTLGMESCTKCHGENLDGGLTGIDCIQCHVESGSCVSCHGGTDNQTGAPPEGLEGETLNSQLAVGAHTMHLEGGAMADGFECAVCHIPVTSIIAPTHIDSDGIAEVTFNNLAGLSSRWIRNNQYCAGTYCHGNFNGGNNSSPIWTTTGQVVCGSCHDIGTDPEQLKWKHNFHISQAGLNCSDCHSTVVDQNMNIIDLALHVNGSIDVFVADSTICNDCHSSANEGSCVFCHGGIDNLTGAPPDGIEGETETSELAVGAHTAHMSGGQISDGFECATCHIVPTEWSDPDHLGNDFIAEITWGGIAGISSTWNRTAATCSDTYCHGNFRGGLNSLPLWTSQNGVACGSCHDSGTNPSSLLDEHFKHVFEEKLGCFECHNNTVDLSNNIIDNIIHVDGKNDVAFNRAVNGQYILGTCSNIGVNGCHDSNETERWR